MLLTAITAVAVAAVPPVASPPVKVTDGREVNVYVPAVGVTVLTFRNAVLPDAVTQVKEPEVVHALLVGVGKVTVGWDV